MKAIKVNTGDNVATLTTIVELGEAVEVIDPNGDVIQVTEAKEKINFGHKIALKRFESGDEVVKYGEVMGVASHPIQVGEWMHTHNVVSSLMNTSGEDMEGVVQ